MAVNNKQLISYVTETQLVMDKGRLMGVSGRGVHREHGPGVLYRYHNPLNLLPLPGHQALRAEASVAANVRLLSNKAHLSQDLI